jgi:hypothetical protein
MGSVFGVSQARRNPKKKNRLPYHARKHLAGLPLIPGGNGCIHSLANHETFFEGRSSTATQIGRHDTTTVSYAQPCVSKHSSKKVQHRDITGRKW